MVSSIKYNLRLFYDLLEWFFIHRRYGLPIDRYRDTKSKLWYKEHRERLLRFKDIHKGEDCFIIGNGPSLNKMDLSKLDGYYCFGLNKIYLMFEKQPLDLSYLISVNKLVIEQSLKIYKERIDYPVFLSYNSLPDGIKLSENIYPLITDARWSFYSDVSNPIAEGYTVTYVAMQIAYYMGFKRVFLIGVDHSYKQKGRSNEEQYYQGDDINHFHPDYFKGQKWNLADIEGNEASYALAKHQFLSDDRSIFDATCEGKLDIFPKITFEEALAEAKKRPV